MRSAADLSRDRLKHDQTLSGSAVIYAAATAIQGQVNFAGLDVCRDVVPAYGQQSVTLRESHALFSDQTGRDGNGQKGGSRTPLHRKERFYFVEAVRERPSPSSLEAICRAEARLRSRKFSGVYCNRIGCPCPKMVTVDGTDVTGTVPRKKAFSVLLEPWPL